MSTCQVSFFAEDETQVLNVYQAMTSQTEPSIPPMLILYVKKAVINEYHDKKSFKRLP